MNCFQDEAWKHEKATKLQLLLESDLGTVEKPWDHWLAVLVYFWHKSCLNLLTWIFKPASEAAVQAWGVFTDSSISPVYSVNPISLAGMQLCYSYESLSSNRAMGNGRKRGGEKTFWVIYSGGSRLNQGMTTVWLTYFNLSPCVAGFSEAIFLWLPGFSFSWMLCEWDWRTENVGYGSNEEKLPKRTRFFYWWKTRSTNTGKVPPMLTQIQPALSHMLYLLCQSDASCSQTGVICLFWRDALVTSSYRVWMHFLSVVSTHIVGHKHPVKSCRNSASILLFVVLALKAGGAVTHCSYMWITLLEEPLNERSLL